MSIHAGHDKAKWSVMLLWILACDEPGTDCYAAWVAEDGGYSIEGRSMPGLEDPVRMQGEAGVIRAGGWVEIGMDGELSLHPGDDLQLELFEHQGVTWPMDSEGLVFLSFWAHLSDTRTRLEEVGLQGSTLPPVEVAYAPTIPDVLVELFPFENAAYLPGAHLVLILPEFQDQGVPLAANRGVVAHEWGHALMHELLYGGVSITPDSELDLEAQFYVSAMHEGFADALSGLLFDDPRFLQASLDMPARWLDQEQMLEDVELPEDFIAGSDLALFYDPYPLGSVVASWYWSLAKGASSNEEVLRLLEAGARSLGEDLGQDDWSREYRWSMLEGSLNAADPSLREYGCELMDSRMAGVELNACSS